MVTEGHKSPAQRKLRTIPAEFRTNFLHLIPMADEHTERGEGKSERRTKKHKKEINLAEFMFDIQNSE